MKVKSIKRAKKLAGKVVLLRVDFNVPLKKGKVAEDYKLFMNLPTIRLLTGAKAKVVIISHLGRPEGSKSKKALSLEPIAKRLGQLLRKPVLFCPTVIGPTAKTMIKKMEPGDILVLENLRFEAGEEKNSSRFARQLAKLANIYVNNAFAVSHRAHASVAAIKRYLPAYAGLLLEQELQNMEQIKHPRRPLVVIIGGGKMSTKVGVIKRLGKKADHILLGGAVANNFLAANKLPIGKSLADQASIKMAKKLLKKNVVLPVDIIVAKGKNLTNVKMRSVAKVGKTEIILDIGPETMKLYAKYIKTAQTLVWNGPMGKFENQTFRHGTMFTARAVASRSKGRAFGLVGGGETIQALRQSKMFDDVDWISTGGGAMLVYLSNGCMPGLKKIVR